MAWDWNSGRTWGGYPIGITGHGAEDVKSMLASPADWISPGRKDGFGDDPPAWDGKKVSLLDTDHVWGVGGNGAWVWKSLLRGHNPLFMDPYDGLVLGNRFDPQWEPIRRNLGYARRLASRLDLAAMSPHDKLASTSFCLAAPGNSYVVYIPTGGEVTVALRETTARFAVEWFNPSTGKTISGRPVGGGEDREFTAPCCTCPVRSRKQPCLWSKTSARRTRFAVSRIDTNHRIRKAVMKRELHRPSPILSVAFLLLCNSSARAEVPARVVYPEKEWKTLTPEEAGIRDVAAWNQWVEAARKTAKGASFQGEDHRGNKWGVAITRGGYLVQTFGDPDYKYQTASGAKAFVQACLQLALDKGLVKSGDDLIKDYWTGAGELNSRHKYLNEGRHVYLTFNHLKTHTGAFPVTNGHSWKLGGENYGQPAPKWARCTNDPDYDNYAHAKPGTVGEQYTSGGYWRLAQALTTVWDKDLKQVMDDNLLVHMGIDPDDWDWLPGHTVHDSKDLYPKMPDYGLFVDPPYKINGHVVRTGGTGIVMNAKDLARYGLLVASGGQWKGKQLISGVVNAGGGNGSAARGYGGRVMGSRGDVTTTMKGTNVPWNLFEKPPGPK